MLPTEEVVIGKTDAFLTKIQDAILNPIIFLLFAAALLLFLWGVVLYIYRGRASGTERSTGARHMIWGSIGMGIMLSVYGIIEFIESSIKNL